MWEKIKILNFNHIWGRTGSARFIETLMSGLDSERFEYHTLVGYAFAPQEQTTSIYTTRNSWWYRNFRYKGAVGCNFFLDWMTPGGIDFEYLRKSSVYQSANIIHLHCIQGGYFDWKILPLIAREKKIVMTLHDDWIVSGNDPINLYHPYKTQHQYQKRSTLLRDIPISYIGVSDWITNKLKNDNILGNNSVKTIYNGIDTDTFYTKNRQESRQRLGLPKNKKIIISLAGSGGKTTAKWLGFVEKIIDQKKDSGEYFFVTLGNAERKTVGTHLLEESYVSPDRVVEYFSAADMFLYPTLMDSFGLIIAESLACGCPVVSFDTGGVKEVIEHTVNGYVAQRWDMQDLITGFDYVEQFLSKEHITMNPLFTQDRLVTEYAALYENITL